MLPGGQRMIPLDSSAIARVGYNDTRRVLRLEYRGGGTYDYFEVPPEIYRELLSSGSVGEFVNREIKPNYDCDEVG